MTVPNRFPYLLLFVFSFILNSHSQTKAFIPAPVKVFTFGKVTTDIVATTEEGNQLFFKALKSAELDCLLNEHEAYTIFVPTNEAFKSISKEKMRILLNADDKMQLKSLLKYHIIEGEVSASKILKALCRGGGRTTLTTVQGTKIRVSFKDNDILLTDNMGNSARITTADLEQSHGYIHQIDKVIMPSRI